MNRRSFLGAAVSQMLAGQIYFPLIDHSVPLPDPILPKGLGAGIPNQDLHLTTSDIVLLGNKWSHNWSYRSGFRPHENYWPALWDPTKHTEWGDGYLQQSLAYPNDGRVWFLDNEPEISNVSPVQAAEAYRNWHMASQKPFAAAGCQVTDEGFDWIKAYLDAGGPIGEAWHWHIYPFERFCPPGYSIVECWLYLLERLVEWNKKVGGNRPLILTETNAGLGINEDIQKDVLDQCEAALDGGMLQAIAWFSLRWINSYTGIGTWVDSWLIDEDHQLTILGKEFKKIEKELDP